MVKPIEAPKRPTDSAIREHFRAKGWPLPEERGRPVVVHIRLTFEYEDPNLRLFVDLSGVLFHDGRPGVFFYSATGPGKESLDKYRDGKGCTRQLPGYYRDFYKWHFHGYKRNHPCLGQAELADYEKYFTGRGWVPIGRDRIRYLNFHRARFSRPLAKYRGPFTEGCKVMRDRLEHWYLMEALGFPDSSAFDWVKSRYSGSGEVYQYRNKSDALTRFDCAIIDGREIGFNVG